MVVGGPWDDGQGISWRKDGLNALSTDMIMCKCADKEGGGKNIDVERQKGPQKMKRSKTYTAKKVREKTGPTINTSAKTLRCNSVYGNTSRGKTTSMTEKFGK